MSNTVKKILDWFKDYEDAFNDCIEDLDSYNGYLGDDRYYSMDDFEELTSGMDRIDLVQRAFFGWDEDTRTTKENGEVEYHSSFNPMREYFKFNGYGNLVSSDYKDYSSFLDEYLVKELAENRCNLYTLDQFDDLSALLDELEAENN